ncbi:hypothetical protein OHA_1_01672 [Pleomorphomonas sp. SM30]|uniref:Uncharacterized protein n=1 Tax=Oharaeibacter diazotrophicus TaxID=1920512 RepID=A0A4R6RB27_9HYPH|nr:DUF6477 family protein [Oharaeibacter diazotrophicus]TDP83252.1 hypothetical protein EDD54_3211 [Oharaeibacter diazotrophicus]BBE72085.1 hypothetical protein OHA_1_01672 [Pleomorphomonas sp. SM30]GLS78850.1 hypothetical protein GCM10007904_41870 [Oharaeibacter diazotrophicus]
MPHDTDPRGPAASRTAVAAIVAEGVARYRRAEILPRLLPVGPDDLGPDGPARTRRLCRLLARALRGERGRGRAGHWSYSLDRHLALVQAYRAERAHLTALEKREGRGNPRPS